MRTIPLSIQEYIDVGAYKYHKGEQPYDKFNFICKLYELVPGSQTENKYPLCEQYQVVQYCMDNNLVDITDEDVKEYRDKPRIILLS